MICNKHHELNTSIISFYISQKIKENNFSLLITKNASDALRYIEEIEFFNQNLKIRLFPDWETLPYDIFSPHPDLISERIETLYSIIQEKFNLVVVPISTLMVKLPPIDYIAAYTFFIKKNSFLNFQKLKEQLTQANYQRVTQVVLPGEYAIKGGIIDMYPMGSVLPYRIELFDNKVESIRSFDPDSQKSIYKVNEIRLLPAKEFPNNEDSIKIFRNKFRKLVNSDYSKSIIYNEVSKGLIPSGIEYYLTLFFNKSSSFFDYLPNDSKIFLENNVFDEIDFFLKETHSRYKLLSGDEERPILNPLEIYLSRDETINEIKKREYLPLKLHHNEFDSIDSSSKKDYEIIEKIITFSNKNDFKIIVIAESLGKRETLYDFLLNKNINVKKINSWSDVCTQEQRVFLTTGLLQKGFFAWKYNVVFITENEIFPSKIKRKKDRKKKLQFENSLKNLSEIKIGDPVVHLEHGIGKYIGLENIDFGYGLNEFLTLQYHNNDKLYVPVSQLDLISRYMGAGKDSVTLHKLGSQNWGKIKDKAEKKIKDTAAELLDLYAKRNLKKGNSFKKTKEYDEFCRNFEYEETPDQIKAINETINDLESIKPMDRLICGDVGFGKTEIALRASFICTSNSKQVVILVPTTLLTSQHFNTFCNRFADFPINIVDLSRFKTKSELSKSINDISIGKVDIVIGTHKILSDEVEFYNLGLIVIDEEHRFGVRQKEKLKAMRAEVDILTLTATPIPRTLSFSLEGLRDLSIISTPPEKRLSIKTFVSNYNHGIIKEAVDRETKRGGLVFFLHNSVDSIYVMEKELNHLLPNTKIKVAHGQMREKELEGVMKEFYLSKFQLLLCTTIIETGIDIPAANTIIINRAENFGLAQLHQLRGRVGRSHHQAYAYLLIKNEGKLKGKSKQRLNAIQQMEGLGSGYFLAMHDLEIRGAGEVLGDSQSGEIHSIGFHLYSELLNQAIINLKNNSKDINFNSTLSSKSNINFHTSALLPENYCDDVNERLIIYKRLSGCNSDVELIKLREEIIDRFGILPQPAIDLIELHRVKIASHKVGIKKISATTDNIKVEFIKNPNINIENLLNMVKNDNGCNFLGQNKIKFEGEFKNSEVKRNFILNFIKKIKE